MDHLTLTEVRELLESVDLLAEVAAAQGKKIIILEEKVANLQAIILLQSAISQFSNN
jgi:hypothetical protein